MNQFFKLFIFFLLTFISLRVDAYFDFGIGVGFRRDDMEGTKFNLDNTLSFTSRNTPDILQFDSFFELCVCNFVLEGYGSYGFFGNETIEATNVLSVVAPGTAIDFLFEGNGNVISINGDLGYCLTLWKDCLYLIPFGGYGYDRYFEKRKEVTPTPSSVTINLPPLEIIQVFLELEPLKRIWWGPFAGGRLIIDLFCNLSIEAAYSYHWLTFSQPEEFSEDIFVRIIGLTSSFFVGTEVLLDGVGIVETKSAVGHRAVVNLIYHINDCWDFGLRSIYFYYSTGLKRDLLDVTETITTLFPVSSSVTFEQQNPGDVTWKSISIAAEISFTF